MTMVRLASVCVTLFAAGLAQQALAWQPTGALDELHDTTLLPLMRPGVKAASFSSYDRTGGNNDGFSGAYSKLREEDGNSVIAEMKGPGCIYRFWMTHSAMNDAGLLDRKGEHIRIYLDGGPEPALDVPIESLFDDSLEHFPQPIAGQGIGGYYCYAPIPYRKSCKVVVDGLGVRFYQLNYVTFPSAEGVETFKVELDNSGKEALRKAVRLWNDPLADLQAMKSKAETIQIVHEPGGKEPRLFTHTLESKKPALIHGITFEGLQPYELEASEIELTFSEASANTIRLPLDFFFGHAFQANPFQSLLFGSNGETYYNRVPIPYQGRCTISIHSILPLRGNLTVYQTPLKTPLEENGALAVQFNREIPTTPGVYHPFLKAEGRGHVVSAYLVTEGPKGLPYWLEGDDRWTIDGELRTHGTGSEDYFNCGWYALPGRLNGPAAKPTHGFPVYGETEHTMRATAFRNHFSDPVPFDNSIQFVIEHGEANRHIANYQSVTYYYKQR